MGFWRDPDWRFERRSLLVILAVAALIVLVFALEPTLEEGRAERLEVFLVVIGEEAAAAFRAGDYEACAALIDEALRTNLVFCERFEELKDDELINLFTPAEVVDYYAGHFTGAAGE